MRRFLRWTELPAGSTAVFGIPAALAAFAFSAAMFTGNVNVTDAADYLKHSRAIFDGVIDRGYPFDYALYRPPFFGTVIALVGELSTEYQIQITLVFNFIVAMFALWMVFKSRLIQLLAVGRIALVVFIFTNVWFFREIITLRETACYALFCIVFVLICQKLYASPFMGAAMGVICGLAMLTRPTGIVFIIASIIIVAALWISKVITAKRLVLVVGSLMIVVSMMLLPWQLYISNKFDRIQLTGSCSGGFTFFKGNHPIMGNLEPAIDLDAADAFVWDYAAKHIQDPVQAASLCARSDFLGAETRAGIKENPLRFLKSVSASLAYIVAPMPVPLGGGDVRFDEASQQLKITSFNPRPITSFVAVFYYAGLYVAALAGALLTRRNRDELLWTGPVVLLILGHAAIYAGTLAEIRFRMPFEPLLCVLAAIAVQQFIKNRFERT